ncbi:hypothetical protein PVBG_05782 [Plasmodium vivax Brazil I]|uniref:Uncharacterized protein n=1 Tax=Plasmodium vivax (strain Brazil I) TaxID=1033975 RepID=A0A0J9SME9_PLAV1|nr:hypothetical protein PVBG_05782 [Plasmodium vivax Brazil I]
MMKYSQLKETVFLQFIFKIIIYKELCEKSVIIFACSREIYKLYDRLDEPLDANHTNQNILNLCDNYDTFNVTFNPHHKSICKKLLRNLFLCNSLSNDEFTNCSSNIYVWLYFQINKSRIADHIIQKIFELPNSRRNGRPKYNCCSYFSFHDNIHNPENLMKLRIFNDNAETFQSMLMGPINSYDCSLIRYIYRCIVIYRDMNSRYCSSGKDKRDENKNSCDIIHNFKNFYTPYISNNNDLTHKFPELTSGTLLNHIDGCSLEGIYSDEAQLGTPITKGVSTALGAMAGIPPFLALIYKVYIIFIQIYEQYIKYTIVFPCSIK